MLEKLLSNRSRFIFSSLLIFPVLFSIGCAVEQVKVESENKSANASVAAGEKSAAAAEENAAAPAGKGIVVEKDSPADAVRIFYKNLREAKFREAIFLTNMRPAVEGLTDEELKDLQVDFANLARQIPADIEINGEIITGNEATVTAKLPDNETDKLEMQQIKLRRAPNETAWTILTLDDKAEKIVRKEGKNYFFNLRIETHEREVKKMFDRINRAEMVFAGQTGGAYGDLPTLVQAGLMPDDALSAESTGYNYKIALAPNKRGYSATATPAEYGKTGRRSFGFTVSGGGTSALKSEDRRGAPVKIADS